MLYVCRHILYILKGLVAAPRHKALHFLRLCEPCALKPRTAAEANPAAANGLRSFTTWPVSATGEVKAECLGRSNLTFCPQTPYIID